MQLCRPAGLLSFANGHMTALTMQFSIDRPFDFWVSGIPCLAIVVIVVGSI